MVYKIVFDKRYFSTSL